MPVGAIVTLCLLGATLIAFGIILALMGGKPKFFKGKRYTGVFNGLKTTFIVGSKTGMTISKELGNATARYCCVVNDVVRDAFSDALRINPDAFKATKHIIVQIMDNDTYVNQGGKKHYEHYAHSGACISRTTCWFWGPEIPTVCVRLRSLMPLVDIFSEQGEPIVHELCHAYENDYTADKDDHASPHVWIETGGTSAIQFKARAAMELYRNNSNDH